MYYSKKIVLTVSLLALTLGIQGVEPTLPDREVEACEILETTIDTQGKLHTTPLSSEKLELYKEKAQSLKRLDPSKDDQDWGKAKVASIAEPEEFFPAYFYSDQKKRILVITLPGVMAPLDAQGTIATALSQYADIIMLGHLIGERDSLGGGFRDGTFNQFLNSDRSKQLGPTERMVADPAQDIQNILTKGITFAYADGKNIHINPRKYDYIIAAGLCFGIAPFIRAQKALLEAGKRGFDGFIMDSPATEYGKRWPTEWGNKPVDFGKTYYMIPELKYLQRKGWQVPAIILRGGLDKDIFPKREARKVLKTCKWGSSILIEHLNIKHTRFMYDDNTDPGIPNAQNPYQRIRGGNAIGSGEMADWLKQNFVDKPKAK